jgi:hypothetical protein
MNNRLTALALAMVGLGCSTTRIIRRPPSIEEQEEVNAAAFKYSMQVEYDPPDLVDANTSGSLPFGLTDDLGHGRLVSADAQHMELVSEVGPPLVLPTSRVRKITFVNRPLGLLEGLGIGLLAGLVTGVIAGSATGDSRQVECEFACSQASRTMLLATTLSLLGAPVGGLLGLLIGHTQSFVLQRSP